MNDSQMVRPAEALKPRLTLSHIGPLIPHHATVMRYAAALGIILTIFALRASLAPFLGVQAPLLPFVMGVLVCAYVSGRSPALLASGIAPVLATLGFTQWPHDAPPLQWLAHVAFFLIIASLATLLMHALQEAVRRAHEWSLRAESAAFDLRENDRRKDEFLAMLAHELRNPLTPIRNVAHILGRAPGDAALVKGASEMLRRQTSHLAHLVDDLLDVARITHRRFELKREVLDLADVLATAIETVQPLLDSRRQLVTTSVTHPQVCGDEVRLCQVITNLLTNASKFSGEGQGIHVELATDAEHARLTVRDAGQGIDSQMMPRLFDLFVQGDRTLDRAQGGLGVGLTIVKHLVEMHGGRVEVSSGGVGQGSEFRIQLPLASAVTAHQSPANEVRRQTRPRRILVVDDNADCAESLRELLRLEGHEVVTAADGGSGLQTLERFTPDLVLLDVGLPRMDGHMVAHAIRARYAGRTRPRIVALSGYAAQEDRLSAMRSGFDDYLTKPVAPAELLGVVSADWAATMALAEKPQIS